VKVQALSPGSDALRLTGKYIDFTAEETFIGRVALDFIKALIPGAMDLIEPEYESSTLAWSGTLRLAGFKFSEMSSDLLDLTT